MAYLRRDTITLIAHHNDTVFRQWLLVDVLSVKQGAIDGNISLAEQRNKVAIGDADMCQTAHGGLYHFRIIDVSSIGRAEDMRNAKPVSNTDNGAYVARILNAVESENDV